MSGCRIGRVKLKSGGEIYRLPAVHRDEVQKDIIEMAAKTAALYDPGEMKGFVVFAFDNKNASTVSYFIDAGTAMRCRLLPSFAADALREKMIETGDWG